MGSQLTVLEGMKLESDVITVAKRTRGRYPEEENFSLKISDSVVADGKFFCGRPSAGARPWIDVDITEGPFRGPLVAALAGLLPPGGYLMVGYDPESWAILRRGVPPVATPLGRMLFDAGCTWFKDWYYPEGWKEGGMKLQGNKPLDRPHRTRNLKRLKDELHDFLNSGKQDLSSDRNVVERMMNAIVKELTP